MSNKTSYTSAVKGFTKFITDVQEDCASWPCNDCPYQLSEKHCIFHCCPQELDVEEIVKRYAENSYDKRCQKYVAERRAGK